MTMHQVFQSNIRTERSIFNKSVKPFIERYTTFTFFPTEKGNPSAFHLLPNLEQVQVLDRSI